MLIVISRFLWYPIYHECHFDVWFSFLSLDGTIFDEMSPNFDNSRLYAFIYDTESKDDDEEEGDEWMAYRQNAVIIFFLFCSIK